MKITSELIERYHRGECTPEEQEVVARWLTQPDDDEAPQPMATELKKNIWQHIAAEAGLSGHTPPIRRVRRMVNPWYAAAACMILTGIAVGWYSSMRRPEHETGLHVSTHNRLGVLHISSRNKHVEIASDVCQLEFDGYLQLINASNTAKTIIYDHIGQKTFVLEPGETYFLEKINGQAYLIPENSLSPEDNYLRFVRGAFHISCNAV